MFHIHGLVPELWCSSFDESLHFYTEVLGFSVTQRRDSDYHAYLELGDAQLMLAHWEQDGTWEPAALEKPYGRGVNFFICAISSAVACATSSNRTTRSAPGLST